jgi:hypothetical protein
MARTLRLYWHHLAHRGEATLDDVPTLELAQCFLSPTVKSDLDPGRRTRDWSLSRPRLIAGREDRVFRA